MTFSDVKECTFRPYVNHKGKKAYSLDEWVEKMGANFEKGFPMVFKMGIFRKAQIAFNRREYLDSYKLLFENFNLLKIKEYFDESFKPEK